MARLRALRLLPSAELASSPDGSAWIYRGWELRRQPDGWWLGLAPTIDVPPLSGPSLNAATIAVDRWHLLLSSYEDTAGLLGDWAETPIKSSRRKAELKSEPLPEPEPEAAPETEQLCEIRHPALRRLRQRQLAAIA